MTKIPIFYKSSDRYEAGTDVIYDDESKLQFAPFIYATTQAKDNGGDTPEPEGGDTMNIAYDANNERYDKTWQEVFDAVKSGKTVINVVDESPAEAPNTHLTIYYVDSVLYDEEAPPDLNYDVYMHTYDGTDNIIKILGCASPSDYLVDLTLS